ncbi:MAG: hypothetical protein V1659_05290 [Candidatus Woesearchaeota archaeon]
MNPVKIIVLMLVVLLLPALALAVVAGPCPDNKVACADGSCVPSIDKCPADAQKPDAAEICSYLKEKVAEFNSNGGKLPGAVPYSNELFVMYTQTNDLIGHVKLENKAVTSVECTAAENPTYNAHIKNIDSLKDIFDSESPVKEFNSKMAHKDIIIKGTTTGKRIKGTFTRWTMRIAGWFM